MQNRCSSHGVQGRCVMHLKGTDIGKIFKLDDHPWIFIRFKAGGVAHCKIRISQFRALRIGREIKRIVLPVHNTLVFTGRSVFVI